MFQKLSPRDYTVSRWSGGTTTQIAIFPPEAKYADRDFLWRISSATVDLEESDFTALPDYERLISTLAGEIVLTHNGGAPLTLRPFEVHAFSGADATHSRGRCTDFNLMLRRGRAAGTMEALRVSNTPTKLDAGISVACPPIPAAEQLLLYCAEGTAHVGAAIGRPRDEPASPVCHSERGEAEPKNPTPSASPFILVPGEALLLTGPIFLTLSGPAILMVCRIKTL